MPRNDDGTAPRDLRELVTADNVFKVSPVVVSLGSAVLAGLIETSDDPTVGATLAIDVGTTVLPAAVQWLDGPAEARTAANAGGFPILQDSFFNPLIDLLNHHRRVKGGRNTRGITSEAKARSSRANGQKGGRPRKSPVDAAILKNVAREARKLK